MQNARFAGGKERELHPAQSLVLRFSDLYLNSGTYDAFQGYTSLGGNSLQFPE
jgi:hypothetical protein